MLLSVFALVSENNRPDNRIDLRLSLTVTDVLERLGLDTQSSKDTEKKNVRKKSITIQEKLITVQEEYLGEFCDILVLLDFKLPALVEQWAQGMEWMELCQNTNLDEGDIVRLMRRTIDLLHQIDHVPNLRSQVYASAKQAAQMIDRFPVNEVI